MHCLGIDTEVFGFFFLKKEMTKFDQVAFEA